LLIDALGYCNITPQKTPNLFNLFQEGFFRPVKTLLGYSNAIIPSIFSGKYPSEHNIWGLYKKSSSSTSSPFNISKLFPSSICDRNLLLRYAINTIIFTDCKRRGLLPNYFTPANIPLKILKYFDISMKKHIIEPDSMNGTLTLFDIMRQNNIRFEYIGYPWDKGSEQIFTSVKNHLQNHSSSVVIAYIDEIDHFEHKHGVYSNDFIKQLQKFDQLCANFLEEMMETEKNKLAITVFSDHGMKDVDGTINLKDVIDSTDLEIEKDYLLFLDSTIARFWTLNENAHQSLVEILSGTKGGRLLSREETIKYKINFKSNIYGDLQFLADSGKLILPNFYTIRGGAVKAMHGWDPDDKTQDSFIFTNQMPQSDKIEDVTKIFDILQENLKVK
jgi:predicted AlkP superfamily pyrophosphatase or phosphodiesterase